MNETPESPPTDGSNTKYAIIGLLLMIGGSCGIYVMTRSRTPAPVVAARGDAATAPPPPLVPQIAPAIELPPEEPDAGPQPPQPAAPRIRYVTRYVDACPGTLSDPGAVERAARDNYGALRACYNRELRSNNQLRGSLSALLKVGTSGRIEDVQVSTPMNSRALVQCVKQSLMRLTVPPARGGCATMRVSYNFAPDN